MKTLLTIIDNPKGSKDFIRYVADMAADLNFKVHLLHVQNLSDYPIGSTGTTGIAVAQAQQNMVAEADVATETLAKQVQEAKSKMLKNVTIEYSTEYGLTSLVVKEFVSENKAHMVVVEGQKDEDFWLQSSDNMSIVENVDCPVWIIPQEWLYEPFTDIVYATDYKEEDITGLKRLMSLTEHFSPRIHVLHLTDNVDFKEKVKKAGFLDILKEQLAYKQLMLNVLSDNVHGDLIEQVNKYAEHVNANLLVVSKENKSFIERIFKTDPAKKIIKNSSLPVLVYHDKN